MGKLVKRFGAPKELTIRLVASKAPLWIGGGKPLLKLSKFEKDGVPPIPISPKLGEDKPPIPPIPPIPFAERLETKFGGGLEELKDGGGGGRLLVDGGGGSKRCFLFFVDTAGRFPFEKFGNLPIDEELRFGGGGRSREPVREFKEGGGGGRPAKLDEEEIFKLSLKFDIELVKLGRGGRFPLDPVKKLPSKGGGGKSSEFGGGGIPERARKFGGGGSEFS